MIKLILFSLFCITCCYGADHNLMKNCSRVDFCNKLRYREKAVLYEIANTYQNFSNSNLLTLTSLVDGGADLTLEISALENDKFRFKIKEVDSKRYELEHVLVEEPKTVPFDKVDWTGTSCRMEKGDLAIVIPSFTDASIYIYQNDDLLMVIPGDRLIFNELDFAFAVQFPKALQLYGIHEHTVSLALPDTDDMDPFRLRNLDTGGHEMQSPLALYGAIPVLYAHGPNSTTGIFFHNAAQQWYDISNGENKTETYIMTESGTLDLFVMISPNPKQVVRQYTELTGRAHMPQMWTLGYHQSRWNYETTDDVKSVVANFTNYDFPMDAIWLDIEYTNGKRYFTWDPVKFADPVEMQNNISEAYKRLVVIIDPHIKAEKGYWVYDGALEKDLFMKNADGSVFEGDCWPGRSSWMDFMKEEARDYYASMYSYENFNGSTPVLAGIWNDMNEPSVFSEEYEKTAPPDSMMANGSVLHRDMHNIYGFLHTMSTHKGLMDRDNGTLRPFILSRSTFAGSQRYAAVWTGDNNAEWGHMAISYPECLNANILGLVFCGADIGGFIGDPSNEMLQRWFQAGAWLPFYRMHSDTATHRREPYLYNEDEQKVMRDALNLRYKHLPVWYTLFYEHTRYGDPVIRPLFYQYPEDVDGFKIDKQLLLGTDILVAPVFESGAESIDVYFPGGENTKWVSIYDNKQVFKGTGKETIPVTIDSIPVYYRAGGIIVTKTDQRLSTDEMTYDLYELYCIVDTDEYATATVYIDDNKSFKYLNENEYSYFKMEINHSRFNITFIDENPKFDMIIKNINIISVADAKANGDGVVETRYDRDANGRLLKDITKSYGKMNSFEIVLKN